MPIKVQLVNAPNLPRLWMLRVPLTDQAKRSEFFLFHHWATQSTDLRDTGMMRLRQICYAANFRSDFSQETVIVRLTGDDEVVLLCIEALCNAFGWQLE